MLLCLVSLPCSAARSLGTLRHGRKPWGGPSRLWSSGSSGFLGRTAGWVRVMLHSAPGPWGEWSGGGGREWVRSRRPWHRVWRFVCFLLSSACQDPEG